MSTVKEYVQVLADDLDWLLRCGKSCLNSTEASMEEGRKAGNPPSWSKTMAFKRSRRRFRRALRAYEEAKLDNQTGEKL